MLVVLGSEAGAGQLGRIRRVSEAAQIERFGWNERHVDKHGGQPYEPGDEYIDWPS